MGLRGSESGEEPGAPGGGAAGRPVHAAEPSRTNIISDADLEAGVANGELRLAYQPKVALATGRIVGFEALLRWDHPRLGHVPPLDFVPLAERTGLIVPIGAWVIAEACREAARWRHLFPDAPALAVSVNVSPRQFGADLVESVAAGLAASRLPRGCLILEVTETVLMTNVDSATSLMRDLDRLGAGIAIDDFGTGYSSLAYLKRFQIDELKIDKSFIDGLVSDARDTAIVAAVVGMAHALDVAVVAEGVETIEQFVRLQTLGCELGQGYLFARAQPAHDIERLLGDVQHLGWELRPGEATGATTYTAPRVLIVDDSPEIRHLARMSLTTVGFSVKETGNGADALLVAPDLKPDCVLLDLNMPGLSGLEVCQALRQDARTADCAIVMLTADDHAATKAAAFSEGADDYIVKPFSPRDLAARVRAAMQRRTAGGRPADRTGSADA